MAISIDDTVGLGDIFVQHTTQKKLNRQWVVWNPVSPGPSLLVYAIYVHVVRFDD